VQDQDRFDVGLSYIRKIADGMEQLKKGQGELIKLQKVRSFAFSAGCVLISFSHAEADRIEGSRRPGRSQGH